MWCDDLPSSSGAGNGTGGGVRATATQNKHNYQHATKKATNADTAYRKTEFYDNMFFNSYRNFK
jgi:hypothetical protein